MVHACVLQDATVFSQHGMYCISVYSMLKILVIFLLYRIRSGEGIMNGNREYKSDVFSMLMEDK